MTAPATNIESLALPPHAELIDLSPAEVNDLLKANRAILVDVREAGEYEVERIPGAFLMPLSFFNGNHFPWIEDKTVVLLCAVGKRSAAAAKQLMQAGFNTVYHMQGGLNAWKDAGLLTEHD